MNLASIIAPLLLVGSAFQTAPPPQEPGRWPFVVRDDPFNPASLLDLRFLNDQVAGERGFITVDSNGDFSYSDGTPVRFWAVNSGVGEDSNWHRPLWPEIKTEPGLERHARFLAKRGVNLVRLHAFINPPADNAGSNFLPTIDQVNTGQIDWIWRAVAAYKAEGIYVSISPYWAANAKAGKNWGLLDGMAGRDCQGLLFFEDKLQEAYKGWLRKLLSQPNPYTGTPLALDPAVAILHLQNEDSLLFWTIDAIISATNNHPYRTRLMSQFYQWAVSKYGSIDAAYAAWNNNTLSGDSRQQGLLELAIIWFMTADGAGKGPNVKRISDQLEFYTTTMTRFNRNMIDFVKQDLGAGFLVNAGNWKTADVTRLEDCERLSYTPTDVMAVNRYYGGVHDGTNASWAIQAGQKYTSSSILKDPTPFPISLRQPRGYPFAVTETGWVPPTGYQAEGPFLVSVYQSLTGVDAFYWFSTGVEGFAPPQSANGYLPDSLQKWTFASPDVLGTFPAAALLYRRGYVKKGEPVLVEERALADMYAQRTPLVVEAASFDPNRDAGNIAPSSSIQTPVDTLAFLAGPVQVGLAGDPQKTRVVDLQSLIRADRKEVKSITGEVTMNVDENWCTVNAPKAQGVAGFFTKRSQFNLADVTIESTNEYAAVLVVSMDDRPLARSGRILVQVGTTSRPTGWQDKPASIPVSSGGTVEGFEIVSVGKSPWQVTNAAVQFDIRNSGIREARVLDQNGEVRASLALERRIGSVHFQFPPDALYVILTKDPGDQRPRHPRP